jgi:lactate permease
VAFRTPIETLAVAAGKGVWDAVFILYVIWPALLLYRVIDNAGGFEALRRGPAVQPQRAVPGARLWLGVRLVPAGHHRLRHTDRRGGPPADRHRRAAVYAVVIPLIGHAWANLFGTLAVAWLGTQQVVTFDNERRTALETAILLVPPNLIAGLTIAWFLGRWAAIRHLGPMIALIALIHGGGQLVLALWDPVLSNFLATTAALLALAPLSRWQRYSTDPSSIENRPALDRERERTEDETEPEAVMSLTLAVVPYAVLTALAVGIVAVGPVERALGDFEVGLPFTEVDTGYDVTNEAQDPYNPFAPLTHPGTFLLGAAAVSWALYRRRNYYETWEQSAASMDNEPTPEPIGPAVVSDAVPASLAIVTFLALSQVMVHSGQTRTLAIGLSEVTPSLVYAFFASWIGLLGSFMTSSNTSSNVIFGPLQDTVAATENLQQSTVLAAQHAGGAVGNTIAPANVVLGTGAAGIVGREGEVLRRVLPYAAASLVVIGAVTLLLGP